MFHCSFGSLLISSVLLGLDFMILKKYFAQFGMAAQSMPTDTLNFQGSCGGSRHEHQQEVFKVILSSTVRRAVYLANHVQREY